MTLPSSGTHGGGQVSRAAGFVLSLGLILGTTGAVAAAEDEVLRLHQAAIVIDTHADTTPWFQDPEWRFDQRHLEGHVDLPRMREGGLDAQFWSIYMGRREGDGRAIREALERIDAVHEMVRRHADQTELATTAAEVREIVGRGKIASLMGVEGGHIIEGSLPALRSLYRLGARYLTLTHSFNNRLADSSGTTSVPEPEHGGLSDLGREVVVEMNRLGMMIDVSHVSDATFWNVVELSRAPVIASHSSARAVFDHPRNMSDDMLRALAKNGGVVMINFYPGYIDEAANRAGAAHAERIRDQLAASREAAGTSLLEQMRAGRRLNTENPWPQAPLRALIDHFDHAIRVAGPEHVGLGADMDGVPSMPEGMEDVSKLPALTRELRSRGHSPDTLRKVLGANLLRAMGEVERVARDQPH